MKPDSMSKSMPDQHHSMDHDGDDQRRRGGRNPNGQPSLSNFLEQQEGRHKTALLPGSTTEDLCSEMSAMVASRGPAFGRSKTAGSIKRPPGRSYTDPERSTRSARRSTITSVDLEDDVLDDKSVDSNGLRRMRDTSNPQFPKNEPRSSISVPGGKKLMDDSTKGSQKESDVDKKPTRKLRDYAARPGGGGDGDTVATAEGMPPRSRKVPSRSKSHDGSSKFPVNRRRASIQGQDLNASFPVGGGDDDDDGGSPTRATSRSGDFTRRLPGRSKSDDGSRGMSQSFGHASFVTGSRIRRITPGSGASGGVVRRGMDASARERSRSRTRPSSRASSDDEAPPGMIATHSKSPVRRARRKSGVELKA